MKRLNIISRARRFLGADESGAAMVEFAIVSMVFFVSFFQLFDFGLFASNNLMAEKAVQLAARIAVVRPSACGPDTLPDRHVKPDTQGQGQGQGQTYVYHTGDACNSGDTPGAVCAVPDAVSCFANATDGNNGGGDTYPTADEIWGRISPMLPPGTDRSALEITYTYDENLGFLGGPYTPMVTVELTLADFEFVSPITEWVIFGSVSSSNTMGYRVISISLPAEDLAEAMDG